MLSPTEVLKRKIQFFFLGIGTFSQSLIIASNLEENDFELIWTEEKETFTEKNPTCFDNYNEIKYNAKVAAKSFYDFLSTNNSSIIRFNPDDALEIVKSPSCLKLIEGAVCSSPDSGSKWKVSYDNHKSFIFKGYLIMHIKIGAIKWHLPKYHYLLRDVAIPNLNEYADKIGKLEDFYENSVKHNQNRT
jgi:hypothetical protein